MDRPYHDKGLQFLKFGTTSMFNICSAICFCVVYSLTNIFMFASSVDGGAIDVGEICVAPGHVHPFVWRVSQLCLSVSSC